MSNTRFAVSTPMARSDRTRALLSCASTPGPVTPRSASSAERTSGDSRSSMGTHRADPVPAAHRATPPPMPSAGSETAATATGCPPATSESIASIAESESDGWSTSAERTSPSGSPGEPESPPKSTPRRGASLVRAVCNSSRSNISDARSMSTGPSIRSSTVRSRGTFLTSSINSSF